MLVHNRIFKLNKQIEYTVFARTVSFFECFPARNQCKFYTLTSLNIRNILYQVLLSIICADMKHHFSFLLWGLLKAPLKHV